MVKYAMLSNDYPESLKIKAELLELMKNDQNCFQTNDADPDFVFVIGGDGTFLSAIHKYENNLDKIVFIPIKFGGIGFYTNHNTAEDFKKIFQKGIPEKQNHFEYSLLEIISDKNVKYALNEIKIVNNIRPLELDVFVNEEKLETFRGTGLVFATPSGSTGFAKSAGGSIIYPNINLFEMLEMFPVSTNKFRTLNAPVIFCPEQVIKLKFHKLDDLVISIDTRNFAFNSSEVLIKISNRKVKVMSLSRKNVTKTSLLSSIFVLNDNSKN